MSRTARVCALAASALLGVGCGESAPRQWLVSVVSDAPVPQFGDHLELEVLGTNATCSGCLRVIGIEGRDSFPVSFGVQPRTESSPVRVRARLYRAEQTGPDGRPDSPALIEAVGQLPPLDGETSVAFDLSMSCFGVPSLVDQGKTCDPATGTLGPEPVLPLRPTAAAEIVVPPWPVAVPRACNGAAPEGMVCVPGGAFLLGAPRPGFVIETDELAMPEHLVQLGPFAMDQDEVTVGTVRALVSQGKLTKQPAPKDKSSTTTLQAACTFLGVSDPANDALPINCVSHQLAEEICAALGKRLPTEAEWEYAAGNLEEETPYPWGSGGNLCALALLGVGRKADEIEKDAQGVPKFQEGTSCRKGAWGPVAGGSPNDVTLLGIKNLAGSMMEWVADGFAAYADACWQPTGTLLVDPVCPPAADGNFSVRGSAWSGYKLSATATARLKAPNGDPYTGLRCALSM